MSPARVWSGGRVTLSAEHKKRKPRAARCSAHALPIPDEAPVMRTTCCSLFDGDEAIIVGPRLGAAFFKTEASRQSVLTNTARSRSLHLCGSNCKARQSQNGQIPIVGQETSSSLGIPPHGSSTFTFLRVSVLGSIPRGDEERA